MTRDPKVSVVIAVRNVGPFIAETLTSLHNQTLSQFEAIVVDDGSQDETLGVTERFVDSRLRVLPLHSGHGVGFARNVGLHAATGPLVVFLDGDDTLLPHALEKMVAQLDRHPDHVACYGQHQKVSEAGDKIGLSPALLRVRPSGHTLWHLLAKNFVVNGGALCIRTAAAREVGGYRTDLALGEDWEFWCRLAMLGDFVPLAKGQIVLEYRQRRGSAIRTRQGTAQEPNFKAIDAIFSIEGLAERFGARTLERRRRRAEMDAFWSASRLHIREGRTLPFINYVLLGLLRYPETVLQARLGLLYFLSLLRARA